MTIVDAALKPNRRWYHLTLDRVLIALLAIDGLLLLVEWRRELPTGWPVLIAVTALALALLLLALTFIVSLVFRWRFQFSVRSLLALVVVVAIPFSWLAVEMKRAKSQPEIVWEVNRLGGVAQDDCYIISGGQETRLEPREPRWIRGLLGDGFFHETCDVDFRGTALNDAQFAEVCQIGGIGSATYLSVGLTKVTDVGLVGLKRWAALQVLDLENTAITDAGLENIAGLSNLTALNLRNTKVTEEGVKKLQRELPKCRIQH